MGVCEWVPRQPRSSGWWVPLVCGFSQAASAHSPHAYSEPGLQALLFSPCSHGGVVRDLLGLLEKQNKTKKTNIEKKKVEKGNLPNTEASGNHGSTEGHMLCGGTSHQRGASQLHACPCKHQDRVLQRASAAQWILEVYQAASEEGVTRGVLAIH